MDRGDWQATVHGGHKESDMTECLSTAQHIQITTEIAPRSQTGWRQTLCRECFLQQDADEPFFMKTSLHWAAGMKGTSRAGWRWRPLGRKLEYAVMRGMM